MSKQGEAPTKPKKLVLKSKKSKNFSQNPVLPEYFREPEKLISISKFFKEAGTRFSTHHFKDLVEEEKQRKEKEGHVDSLIDEKSIQTELSESQLVYMYDIAKMSVPFEQFFAQLNSSTLLTAKGKSIKLDWKIGLRHDLDLSDVALQHTDQIVMSHIL